MYLNQRFLFLSILTFIVLSCKKTPEPGNNGVQKTAPFVTLTVAGSITTTSALVNCEVNSDGGAEVTARGFCWGMTSKPTISDNKSTDGAGVGKFSTTITGLTPATTYYVRAYATNSVGTTYGLETSFPTSEAAFSTANVTSITLNGAVGGGYTPADPTVTARGIIWSTSTNITPTDSKTTVAIGSGNFVSSMTGLNGGTTYYVAAYVIRPSGMFLSNTVSFTTPTGVPVLSTAVPTAVRSYSAASGGIFTFTNGVLLEQGLCWSLTDKPNINDFKVKLGTDNKTFTGNMTGLGANTTFYVRAYAITSAGIGYGQDQIVKTMPTVTDAEGNVYETVKIGNQTWMGSNLKTRRFNNGDAIATTADPFRLNVSNIIFPLYQWAYGGDEKNVPVYGRLYTWNVVKDARQIAPIGWHIPSDQEYQQLSDFVGEYPGGKLKEAGTAHWQVDWSGEPGGSARATDSYGFAAVGSGVRHPDDTRLFEGLRIYTNLWSATPLLQPDNVTLIGGRNWRIHTGGGIFEKSFLSEFSGAAVRCIKN